MLLALVLLVNAGVADTGAVYHGRSRALAVQPPRYEAAIEIDGVLDEAPWSGAAVLTGFSQYAPSDGVPAADSTEVLVWYSPTAIHFGIRAFEAHGAVHATLAERDRIGSDDYVQLYLGTFNDGRQATVLGVNPLGVQMDGVLVETGRTGGSGFNNATVVRESADLSPDFVFQSKGRVTPRGYEIEVRVPFKSLRFQPGREQTWGINVVRRVQHSGAEDSWAPARRASPTFLGQSGRLEALTEIRRGLVLDLNPEITARIDGAPGTAPGGGPGGGYTYTGGRPDVGGNVRWGITNNLNLNGTVNPDFSQVESDAGQFAFDPRQALFFSEKRPFFLDGIEQFNAPSNLIYTRRIVQPVAAAKVTGKAFGTDLAFLSAVDDDAAGRSGTDHPVYNILRVQRDLGRQSRLGMAYTDRIEGGDYNRVGSVDGRVVFGGLYSTQFQLAGSRTRLADATSSAALWSARFDRNGRTFKMRYSIFGVGENFVAGSGFISRPGIVNARISNSLTGYGGADAFLQSITGEVALDGTWQYRSFVGGDGIQDRKLHFNANGTLRGGWRAGASLLVEDFGYEPGLYENYAIEVPLGGGVLDTVAFTGTPRIPNLDWVLSGATPEFRHFSANFFVLWGHDENFDEWASGDIIIGNATVNWRPTDKVRVEGSYQHQQVDRRTDGSTVSLGRIPRLKLEYQVSRPLFVRLVGEYSAFERDSLRDDSRTGFPILICESPLAGCARTAPIARNAFRSDLLVAYQPSPGTVIFAGYGSTMREPEALRFGQLTRVGDGFFAKLSYLFRL